MQLLFRAVLSGIYGDVPGLRRRNVSKSDQRNVVIKR